MYGLVLLDCQQDVTSIADMAKGKQTMPEYIVQIEDSEKNMSERFVGQLRSYPELIRCKNCVKSQYDFMTKGYWCDGKQVSEHHYCGYAERKPDDA